jgi:hypothetical protein
LSPLFLAIAGFALVTTSLTGDGYDYMLTMQALYEHGTPDITHADLEALKRSAGGMPFYGATLGDLIRYSMSICAHPRRRRPTPSRSCPTMQATSTASISACTRCWPCPSTPC